ncbi:hypothetical protein FACS189454_02480 [Planctomycetales bacterium]|nr:hypothetical protein FACS189454_02480 [Planctomycetales bacterium]
MEYYYKEQDSAIWRGPFSEADIKNYRDESIFVPVYNYSSQDYIIETLQTKRLKISLPSKMNDPFECLFAQEEFSDEEILTLIRSYPHLSQEQKLTLENSNEKRAFVAQHCILSDNEIYESMDRTALFRSFTKYKIATINDNLLWSHYAKDHTGLRIGYKWNLCFNPKDELQGGCYFLDDVIYSENRPIIPKNLRGIPPERARKFMLDNAKTKSTVWAYEDEIRLFVAPPAALQEAGVECFTESRTDSRLLIMESQIIEENGLTFLKFHPGNIFSIDFGCRCPYEFKQSVLEVVKEKYPHITVSEAVLPRNGYVLEYPQIISPQSDVDR